MANEIVSGKQESGSTNNVLHHPSFGHAPVKNIKAPGRKKGTASLHAARYKRWMKEQQPANPEPQSVQLPKPEQGKFFYPKAMLSQAYFCLGGTGIWSKPTLDLSMLAHKRFVSPMGALLDQLEAEGHNVGGARAEWLAFRELAAAIDGDVFDILSQVGRLTRRRPIAATAFYDDGPK